MDENKKRLGLVFEAHERPIRGGLCAETGYERCCHVIAHWRWCGGRESWGEVSRGILCYGNDEGEGELGRGGIMGRGKEAKITVMIVVGTTVS
jgi:hypothetical protein